MTTCAAIPPDPFADAPLARARTLLFVPGHRPERFAKAMASGADGVVLDLEDAVPPAARPAAREAIAAAWPLLGNARGASGMAGTPGVAATGAPGLPIVVRINSLGSPARPGEGHADLAWLAQAAAAAALPNRLAVMLAKAESAEQIGAVARVLPGVPVLPLIESAAGLVALPAIARAAGVLRLVVGHLDFIADTGIQCSEDERELDPLRFAVALHTRAAGLAPAIDGVTVAIDDEARLAADTRRALRFGFGGKLCIHPRQAAGVHAALAPADAEVDWARRVLAAELASGGAAVQLDGRMIDLPVVLQARRTLARARPGA